MLQYSTLTNKRVINNDYLKTQIYDLLDQTFTFPKTEYSYNLVEVEREYIARPDLISLDAYGDPSYADIICKINGVSNPFELNEGMILVIPAPENISDFIYQSSIDEYNDGELVIKNNVPIPKSKSEKRKPNEAIVGNKRFKIDNGSKIIIY